MTNFIALDPIMIGFRFLENIHPGQLKYAEIMSISQYKGPEIQG